MGARGKSGVTKLKGQRAKNQTTRTSDRVKLKRGEWGESSRENINKMKMGEIVLRTGTRKGTERETRGKFSLKSGAQTEKKRKRARETKSVAQGGKYVGLLF